jgi:hypothetical protein
MQAARVVLLSCFADSRKTGWYQWVDATPAEIYSEPGRLRTSIGANQKLLKGSKNQLLFGKNPEKPKTSCLRRTSDSLVVLHRPVETAGLFVN